MIVLPLKEITKRYKAGETFKALAKEFNVCDATLRKYLWYVKRNNWTWNNLRAWRETHPQYQVGAANPRWKGGTSRSNIRRLCKRLLEDSKVDMYTCQNCGKLSTIRHNIHHKDLNPLNNIVSNLEVLCSTCHNSGASWAKHKRQRSKTSGRFL